MLLFEYSWVFYLLPMPILLWWILPVHREEQQAVRIPFFEEAAKAAGLKPSAGAVIPKRNLWQWILGPLCWTLAVAALARPQWVEDPIEQIQSARDLMLALDLSQSMETRDFVSSKGKRMDRLQAVKEVVDEFVTRRKGDRIGLIVYGTAAYPQVPFTLDHESVRLLLDETSIGMAGPQTAIGDAIGLAIKMFEASEVEERVLILLTDGNDTASKMPPDRAGHIAAKNNIVIHTIGIGDPSATGEEQVDLETLKQISVITGGKSFRGENREQLEGIYDALDEMTPQNYESYSYRPKIPLFHWPLGGSVGLVLFYHIVVILWTSLRRPPTQDPSETRAVTEVPQ